MARTTKLSPQNWDTFHKNGPFPLKFLYKTKLEGAGVMPSRIDRYNDAALEIQRLIKESKNQNHGFRAYGSAWSMSNIAHQKDRMHFNTSMNLNLPVATQDLHALSSYNAENLFLFECGNTIKEISRTLEFHGKSLKTTGASNGQTIAGCISTGVHGSALGIGSVQDYVVGLNLIIGPNPGDIVYLERHTKPAINDVFAQKLKARIIRNDGLFNAALVGLGAFGFIHGVVIEAQNLFLLKRYVRKIDKNVAMKLADTMDFKNSSFKITGETDSNGKPKTPYHYKIFINQYKDDGKYIVECMYKHSYRQSYPDPFPVIEQSLYRDLIKVIMGFVRLFPGSIPTFISGLQNSVLPTVNEESTGTLAETFYDAPFASPAFAISFGVDHKNASKAYKILADVAINDGPIPGIFAMRFIKKSKATLSFAKFPVTCMIEVDGVLWKPSNGLISLKSISKKMIEALKANNLPFTIHWGKNSNWAFPGLANHMYGDKAKEWKRYRSALLSDDMQKLFSNGFLDTVKLSSKETPIPPNLIASLI